jgi:hypothetical protein
MFQLDSLIFISIHNCVTGAPSNQHQVISNNQPQALHPHQPHMVQPNRPQMSHSNHMQHFSPGNNVQIKQSFHFQASTYFKIKLFLLKTKFPEKLYVCERMHPQILTILSSKM